MCSLVKGDVVPIPTLPVVSIFTRSVTVALLSPVLKDIPGVVG